MEFLMTTNAERSRALDQADVAPASPATPQKRRRTGVSASTQGEAVSGELTRPEKLTRAQRAANLRENLLRCAAIVVGEFGYQDASIARITQMVGVAQGTFYRYFETRQHLFDELLPHAGQDMMHYIGARLHGAKNFLDAEERGLRAFFDYLRENPGFYRVLNEAEFAAPIGHKKHFEQLIEHYTASMRRSVRDGSLRRFTDVELEAIAYTMMSSRSYIYLGYVKYGGKRRPPEAVIKVYMSLIERALI